MAHAIKPWLRNLLAEEITGVLNWKKTTITVAAAAPPKIKLEAQDDESRYQDNGSSYLIEVDPTSSQIVPSVQLVKVISLHKPVTVLLSDGELVISATLSESSVQTIEEAIDCKLDANLEKDVLSLQAFTIIAAHEGPICDAFSLDVHELRYLHMLRKFVGSPVSLDEDMVVKQMIESIKGSRKEVQSYPSSVSYVTSESHDTKRPANTTQDERLVQDRSTILTQTAEVVSAPVRMSHHRPDDTEIALASGVNLAAPQTAIQQAQPNKLLHLLKTKAKLTVKPQETNTSRVMAPALLDPGALYNQQKENIQLEKEPYRPVQQNATSTMSCSSQASGNPAERSTTSPRGSAKKTQIMKGKVYDIADDQRALLDKSSSWIPSLPGSKAPLWNVPSSLLSAWNDHQDHAQDIVMANHELATRTNEPIVEESEPDDSDDEMVSDWASSPVPGRSGTPPDSSGQVIPSQANIRPSSSGSIEEAIPRAFGANVSAHHAARTNHMRHGQRMKWLKDTYGGDDAPAFNAFEAQAAYMKQFPGDAVTMEMLKALYGTILTQLGQDRTSNKRPRQEEAALDETRSSPQRTGTISTARSPLPIRISTNISPPPMRNKQVKTPRSPAVNTSHDNADTDHSVLYRGEIEQHRLAAGDNCPEVLKDHPAASINTSDKIGPDTAVSAPEPADQHKRDMLSTANPEQAPSQASSIAPKQVHPQTATNVIPPPKPDESHSSEKLYSVSTSQSSHSKNLRRSPQQRASPQSVTRSRTSNNSQAAFKDSYIGGTIEANSVQDGECEIDALLRDNLRSSQSPIFATRLKSKSSAHSSSEDRHDAYNSSARDRTRETSEIKVLPEADLGNDDCEDSMIAQAQPSEASASVKQHTRRLSGKQGLDQQSEVVRSSRSSLSASQRLANLPEEEVSTKLELFREHWRDMMAWQRMRDRRLREKHGQRPVARSERLQVLSWTLP